MSSRLRERSAVELRKDLGQNQEMRAIALAGNSTVFQVSYL